MNWHAIGGSFVGITSLLVGREAWAPRRQAAKALLAVYGIWSLQNLHLTVATRHFTSVTWLHARFCAVCAVLCVRFPMTPAD